MKISKKQSKEDREMEKRIQKLEKDMRQIITAVRVRVKNKSKL